MKQFLKKSLGLAGLIVIIYMLLKGSIGCNKEPLVIPTSDSLKVEKLLSAMPSQAFDRILYLDKFDTIFNDTTKVLRLAKKMQLNHFNGFYAYKANIFKTRANFPKIEAAMKIFTRYGINIKGVVIGGSDVSGIDAYNTWQSNPALKVNNINKELEWWNGASTFSQWITEETSISNYGNNKGIPNGFYMGWYLNLGGLTDSAAAAKQIACSDYFDLHDYQNNTVSYGYTASRWLAIAKAANTPIDGGVIISLEQTAWGAGNNFQGNLAKSIGYDGIETRYINDFNSKAPAIVKAKIKIKRFVYFDKEYFDRVN